MMLIRKIFLFTVCHFLIASSLFAQEKFQPVHWEIKDGLIDNAIHGIIKDKYGFIWLAHHGLSRFDGKKFINYGREAEFGLVEDSLHNIWVGSGNGLSRFDILADSFMVISSPAQNESTTNFITPFWATRDEVYCVEKGSQITSYNTRTFKKKIVLNEFRVKEGPGGSDFFRFHFSVLDPSGNGVWMLDRGGLTEITFSSGVQQYYPLRCRKNINGEDHDAPGMCYDKKRNLIWLNTTEGLVEFDLHSKQFSLLPALNELLAKKNLAPYPGISIDPKGKIWFATIPPNGILIYDPDNESINPAFSDPAIQQKVSEDNMCLYCDRESTAWTGKWSRKGIYQVTTFSKAVSRYNTDKTNPGSISSDEINSIINGPSGKLWIGTDDGINIFDPVMSVFNPLRKNELKEITGNIIQVLAVDTVARKAWIACSPPYRFFEVDLNSMKCRAMVLKDQKAKIIQLSDFEKISSANYKNGCIVSVRGKGAFLINSNSLVAQEIIRYSDEVVTTIATGDDQFLFLRLYGTSFCRTYINRQNDWKLFSTPLDSSAWFCIFFNKDDSTYWAGGIHKLLHYTKNFKPIPLTIEKNDIEDKIVLSIEKDNTGNLWFNCDNGEIAVFNKATGRINKLAGKDGYTKQLFGFDNPRAKDIHGDIYFAGDDGLDRISPSRLSNQFPSSSVFIHSIQINGKKIRDSSGINEIQQLSLKYFQNRISIETGNMDFYSKGESRIRYKLKGPNDEWQYGPDYSTIQYEQLAPGDYTLVIQASNVADEFNGPEKILVIKISPPFWKTWWFRTMTLIAVLLLLYGIYRWRTATLRKQKRILEQTVKERTAEVVEEKAEVEKQKAKSDELLLNILPSEVAEELKEKGYTTAKSFDEATILFSDIKGFTHVAEKLTAQELVQEINNYFSAFDRIMLQYGLEKIKTIGDAYIAAGGLPEGNTANAKKVVEAAIAMQKVVDQFGKERVNAGRPYFELRIGIHTGPVIAGVVGIKKFQYDIWGDTVNLAARMEQAGIAGKINVSQHTYEIIKDDFTCIHRGKIEAKNKGEIDMYFVETTQLELS